MGISAVAATKAPTTRSGCSDSLSQSSGDPSITSGRFFDLLKDQKKGDDVAPCMGPGKSHYRYEAQKVAQIEPLVAQFRTNKLEEETLRQLLQKSNVVDKDAGRKYFVWKKAQMRKGAPADFVWPHNYVDHL